MDPSEERSVLKFEQVDKEFRDHVQGTLSWYWNELSGMKKLRDVLLWRS